MSGAGQSSQTTQTQSQSSPWKPTQPLLKDIIGQLQGVNTAVTPMQTSALNQIQQNSQGLPNLSPQVAGLSNQLLGGIPNLNQNLAGSAQQSQNALSPYLQSNYLNPNTNPFQSQVLNTINQDVQNQVGSLWAGAGLTPNGGEAQAMARGLSQGLATPLFNQYNQNVQQQQNAAGMNMNIAGQANTGLLGNANAGIQNLPNIANAANLGPLASLQASNMAYNLPLSQLGGVENMTLPIAGLGGQTSGTASGQYNPSMMSMLGQGVGILGGLFG